jgi:hypothetical protein
LRSSRSSFPICWRSNSGPFTLLSADAAFTAYGCPLQDARG